MKLLVDMNLSPSWVRFLTDRGFEAVHWSEVGPGDASDAELLRWAAERGHVVLTSDLDFGAILAATQERQPSVVQIRSDLLTPKAIGVAVLTAIQHSSRDSRWRAAFDRCSKVTGSDSAARMIDEPDQR
jgi:predicted nuclease of predicted toxin-antitoxin system